MIVVCPGTFDPITRGHLDIIGRAAALFEQVVVAVGTKSTKDPLFDLDERTELVRESVAQWPGVSVAPLDGLLVDFCAAQGARAVVKGIRFGSDFDYELQMSHVNRAIGGIETVLLPSGEEFGTISSTLIRNVASLGGDVSRWLTEPVQRAITAKLAAR